eukprot:ctg_5810.g553
MASAPTPPPPAPWPSPNLHPAAAAAAAICGAATGVEVLQLQPFVHLRGRCARRCRDGARPASSRAPAHDRFRAHAAQRG